MATFTDPKLALDCFEEAGEQGLAQFKNSMTGKTAFFVALVASDWNSLYGSAYCDDVKVIHDGQAFTPFVEKWVENESDMV